MGSNKKRSHEPIYKTYTKIEAKRLKATSFALAKLEEQMGSNRENSNIAIIILKKLPFLNVSKIISHFYGSNNIFADSTCERLNLCIFFFLKMLLWDATLWDATLWGATLWDTTLGDASLWVATLWGATLWVPTLLDATLWDATLWDAIC